MAAKRGMNERIQKLRELSVTTPVHIDLERAKIETEFYKENDGKYSIPVMRSMVLKEYFSKKTLYLGEGELIVGEKGKDPQASPTFPELCCHSVEDMTVMSERDLVSFHTTEEDREIQEKEIVPYWSGRSMREKILAAMTPEWNDCYSAGMFTEFMEQRGPGHTCGGEQNFKVGYLEYKEKIKKTMDALDFMNANGFLAIDTSSSIYVFANLFSNIAYTFLQILIAFSAAKAFGANQYLGAVIGMIMIHPSLQNAYTVATEGVQQTQSVFFGLYHIDMVGYQGHVIPVIIAVWILSVLEKKLHKVVPAALDLFVTPLVSVFVTGYLTLSIVGPIFVWGENAILGAIQWMLTLPLGLGSLIMGGLYAPTVVTGIHQMYTAIDIGQLAKYGVTYWLPLASAANVAQGAAALAVGVKSKDQKIKSLALPSSLSAFMGITEPAIFGVNLRFFKPFIAGCIGGGCGALYASLVHLGAKGTGVTGIFGILLCLNQPFQYIIEMAISVGVAFVISFMIYKDKEPVVKTAATETTVEKTEETENVVEAENVSAEEITSPVNGNVVATTEVADETFASEMLGTTVAVEPTDGKIVAPCDGEVMNIFDTGHAVCIATEAGAELLIHIGIDTVSMDGKGFVKKVADGAKVRKGDVLIEADLDAIKAAGHPTTTMMILTNADDFSKVEKTAAGTVTTADLAMKIEK